MPSKVVERIINLNSEDIAVTFGGSGHKPHDQHLTRPRCLGQLILVEDPGPWTALISVFKSEVACGVQSMWCPVQGATRSRPGSADRPAGAGAAERGVVGSGAQRPCSPSSLSRSPCLAVQLTSANSSAFF